MKTEDGVEIKENHLIFGLIMVILAACFTILSGIKPNGDSSNFPGRTHRFADFITTQLERVFPHQYNILKVAQFWIDKFSAWLKDILPSKTKRDEYKRREGDSVTKQNITNGGK
jgi:hypothetical protein